VEIGTRSMTLPIEYTQHSRLFPEWTTPDHEQCIHCAAQRWCHHPTAHGKASGEHFEHSW